MAHFSHPPRVAFLSTVSGIGGVERVICGLSRQFSQRGWQVHTVFPETENKQALLQWCRDQGVQAETSKQLLDISVPRSWADIARLKAYIRSLGVDVVNIHFGGNYISLKDIIAIRAAGMHHCAVSVHHPTSWRETGQKKRLMTALASRLAHDVVTVSQASYKILREAAIPAKRLHIIPCGLRPPTRLIDRSTARQRLGLPRDALLIGSLGRLVAHKGNDDLIKAVARVATTRENIYLLIGGTGPERMRLEALATRMLPGRCIFLDYVPDVDEYLAALDIFALPSHMEGFGLVYVEAAFHGVPSVATNAGGIPDVVLHQKTGLLVPVGDNAALSRALEQLCDDRQLRNTLGEAARVRANSELVERIQAERYEELFYRTNQ